MKKGCEKMNLKEETKNNISKAFKKAFGITYEAFEQLDIEEQQKLIAMHRKNQKRKKSKEVIAMIGSGEDSIFIRVKKGERIMVGSGEESCFVRAGITPEEASLELDDKIDDALYSKPVAFVKKMKRRIQRK